MDTILHYLETMGNYFSVVFTGESSCQGFFGGAGFRPSTVMTHSSHGQPAPPRPARASATHTRLVASEVSEAPSAKSGEARACRRGRIGLGVNPVVGPSGWALVRLSGGLAPLFFKTSRVKKKRNKTTVSILVVLCFRVHEDMLLVVLRRLVHTIRLLVEARVQP